MDVRLVRMDWFDDTTSMVVRMGWCSDTAVRLVKMDWFGDTTARVVRMGWCSDTGVRLIRMDWFGDTTARVVRMGWCSDGTVREVRRVSFWMRAQMLRDQFPAVVRHPFAGRFRIFCENATGEARLPHQLRIINISGS